MEQMNIDCGVRSFRINEGGVLRFNPCDPNVYERFHRAVAELDSVTKECSGPDAFAQADRKLKAILSEVFGAHNDFDAILGGVNLLARAGNGKAVIINLLEALAPVLEQGAKAFVQSVIAHE